jgi:phosphoribosylanthranilate isomerase
MPRVKICGITNLKDAKLAEKLGADIEGFIFAESPRRITPEKAGKIIKKLSPGVLKAGVFVNEKASEVNNVIRKLHLNIVQLSGDEQVLYLKQIKGAMIVKVIRVKNLTDLKRQAKKYEKYADAFLFDTYSKEARGGTGMVFDWKMLKGLKLSKPFFVAGGINPENVSEAIKESGPYGVDVCSGVEREKGKKSEGKMRKLLQERAV